MKTINNLTTRLYLRAQAAKAKLLEKNGQFVMDHAVVFVLILVLGGIVLTLLTAYLQNDLSTTIKGKINDFFS